MYLIHFYIQQRMYVREEPVHALWCTDCACGRFSSRQRMGKERTGTGLVNVGDTSGARDRAKDTNMYIFMIKYRTRKRLQPIRPAKQMLMPVRLPTQGTRWRYCRKHTGVSRSSTSLPKVCRRRKLWRMDGGEAFGFGLTALRPL